MAHKKAGVSSLNGRDAESKRLGVQRLGGERVTAVSSLVLQRCTRYHNVPGVGCGRDHTLFALKDGEVRFDVKGPRNRRYISIVESAQS
ncbi:50S ribosomal protein L27 [Thiohalocapsa sp.]|uniref:50S ribosomal protein L27 n=1 Tax=Thiohalocapsa sp. TaxID=2497641 RepID=UPI0025F93A2F|nr:50S ribosomal protein L27 [Thiohalocapsa sp.]